MAEQNYSPGGSGWVVRSDREYERGIVHLWWYGPDSGFGTTYGGLGFSVRVWPTKRAAEEAVRSVYGQVRAKAHQVERVQDAEATAEAQRTP